LLFQNLLLNMNCYFKIFFWIWKYCFEIFCWIWIC
jgi:hypothetical protein